MVLDSGMMTTRLTMLMMKKGSQQSTNTTTMTTTIWVTLRSERRRLVTPARSAEDFTCTTNSRNLEMEENFSRNVSRIAPHLDDDEQVAKADDEQGPEESHRGGVENEGRGPHVLGLRPDHVAGVERFLGATTKNIVAVVF